MQVALQALALAALVWLTIFQLLLAAGVPLGHMAWGGAERVLPAPKRLASLAAAGLTVVAALCLAARLSLVRIMPEPVVTPALFVLSGLFALSVLGNAASSSRAEKIHGTPLAALIAAGCLAGALS